MEWTPSPVAPAWKSEAKPAASSQASSSSQKLPSSGHTLVAPFNTQASTASSSSSSQSQSQSQSESAPVQPRKKLKFSSKEVLDLCWSRRGVTRFPDVLAKQRNKLETEGFPLDAKNREWAAKIFCGYIEEHENSDAEFRITNEVDHEPHPPLDFCWTNDYVLGSPSVSHGAYKPHGCDCDDDECDPKTCSCLQKMKELDPATWADISDFPYNERGDLKKDVLESSVIWECNDLCGCASTCRNRSVQFGRKHGIELFKTDNGRGWGLKAINDIPVHSFVLYYTGELLDATYHKRGDTYDRVGMTYLLSIDTWHVFIETLYRPYNEVRVKAGKEPLPLNSTKLKKKASIWGDRTQDPKLTVDAAFWGNLSRYINHSCEPNLGLYPVYFGPQAGYIIRPYLVFFSKREIRAGEELTFSYSNTDPDDEDSQRENGSSDTSQSDDDTDDSVVEQSASQFPRSLSTKGFKGKAQRKMLQSAEDDSQLNSIGAQKCLCGTPSCRGKFWR
ncbi:hypothetical protein OC835_001623 [Tilletia horrida]|nr:hypothetical protein OC835_001623 [Tilletia horrida]